MDTRVGYPNEHLAGDSDKEITSPLFATSVGLVMDGLQRIDKQLLEDNMDETLISDDSVELNETGDQEVIKPPTKPPKPTTSFLDKLTDRLKDFLDNAE
jgi:cell division protein FtsA